MLTLPGMSKRCVSQHRGKILKQIDFYRWMHVSNSVGKLAWGRRTTSSGQWIESVTDWAIRITDWCLSTDWTSSHARLLDPIRPMPDNGSFEHPGSPIALISRLPDWAVQSVLPIAIPPIAPSILSTGQIVHDIVQKASSRLCCGKQQSFLMFLQFCSLAVPIHSIQKRAQYLE